MLPCRGHHGRPSILLRFRKPASLVAPVRFSLTTPANALTQPVARKQLAALQAPTLLALVLVLAFRLWLQFAHASRKRLSKQFHPERVVAYPQRRHFTFRTWPLPPRSELLNPAVISGGIVGCRDSNTNPGRVDPEQPDAGSPDAAGPLALAIHNQRITVRYTSRAGNIGMGGGGEQRHQGGGRGERHDQGNGKMPAHGVILPPGQEQTNTSDYDPDCGYRGEHH